LGLLATPYPLATPASGPLWGCALAISIVFDLNIHFCYHALAFGLFCPTLSLDSQFRLSFEKAESMRSFSLPRVADFNPLFKAKELLFMDNFLRRA
jgi:hypothetical protein